MAINNFKRAIIIDLDSFFNINDIDKMVLPFCLEEILKYLSSHNMRLDYITAIFVTSIDCENINVYKWLDKYVTKYVSIHIFKHKFNYEVFKESYCGHYEIIEIWVEHLTTWENSKFNKKLNEYEFRVRPLILPPHEETCTNNEYTEFYENMIGY